ncbi:MAG: DUF2868 domain-containing protein [Lautropia sp.]|nr:DUF2868 domain-containing protein [Lautropia sp.]
MTEHDAQQVLLVRAVERQPASPIWTDEDRRHVTDAARRQLGPDASADTFIIARARLACAKIGSRRPALAGLIHSLQWRSWFAPLLLALACLAGAILDSASGPRVNILNPPLLLIILWNLFTYLVLAVNTITTRIRAARPSSTRLARSTANEEQQRSASHAPPENRVSSPGGWLQRHLLIPLATGQRWKTHGRTRDSSVATTFRDSWLRAAGPLYGQRALCLLHGGALAFALGALGSLYLHGLALEYRAGWESTFLSPPQVETFIHLLWGVASQISGIPLPDANALAMIRFPLHQGENAAHWIHLQTLTILLIVILPRLVLALLHGLRARQLARHFPLALDESYFRDLLRSQRGEAALVWAQPYSYHLDDTTRAGLNQLLQRAFDCPVKLHLQPPLALGEEDDLPHPPPGSRGAALAIAVYSLSATPEAENHATFLSILGKHLPAGTPLAVLVDESGFLARFGTASNRQETRRHAWRRILASRSNIPPLFVNLAANSPEHEAVNTLGAILDGTHQSIPAMP